MPQPQRHRRPAKTRTPHTAHVPSSARAVPANATKATTTMSARTERRAIRASRRSDASERGERGKEAPHDEQRPRRGAAAQRRERQRETSHVDLKVPPATAFALFSLFPALSFLGRALYPNLRASRCLLAWPSQAKNNKRSWICRTMGSTVCRGAGTVSEGMLEQ